MQRIPRIAIGILEIYIYIQAQGMMMQPCYKGIKTMHISIVYTRSYVFVNACMHVYTRYGTEKNESFMSWLAVVVAVNKRHHLWRLGMRYLSLPMYWPTLCTYESLSQSSELCCLSLSSSQRSSSS